MNDLVIAYLRRFIGIAYIWDGKTPMGGFDCSGLVCEGLRYAGLMKNHEDFSSNTLYMRYGVVPPEQSPIRPGSLLFFGTKQKVIHVAMATSATHMIEAGGGTESTRNVDLAIQRGAFVRERPIFGRSDFVAAYMPPYPTVLPIAG